MKKMVKAVNEESFKRMMVSSIIGSLLMLFAGLIIYLFPDVINNFFGYIIGILCFISGLDMILKFFKRQGARLYSLNIIFGLLLFILGLIIVINPNIVVRFITICFALLLIIKGGNRISYGSWLKVGSHKSWSLIFFTGLIQVAFGVLLFLDIVETLDITKIIGLLIVVTNLLDIIDSIMINNKREEIVQIFW